MNSLRNLSQATMSFEMSKKRYPGYQEHFGAKDGLGKVGSWVIALIPMLESQPLRDYWDDFNEQENWAAEFASNQSSSDSRFYSTISLLTCYSDKSLNSKSSTPTSYAANTGFYLTPNDPALKLESLANTTSDSERSTISQRAENGVFVNLVPAEIVDPISKRKVSVFGPAKAVKLGDIRDGLSQTICFTESARARSWRHTSLDDDSARWKLGVVWLYAGVKSDEGKPTPIPASPEMTPMDADSKLPLTAYSATPASMHHSVNNVGFLDGSVMALSKDIDYQVYQALMTPNHRKSDAPYAMYILKDDDYRN
jgi:hypothetical protein